MRREQANGTIVMMIQNVETNREGAKCLTKKKRKKKLINNKYEY